MPSVKRHSILLKIANETGLDQRKIRHMMQITFDEIINGLVRGDKAELRGFGVFKVRKRAAYTGRNPKTGEAVQVPEKLTVTFKAGHLMKEWINAEAKRNSPSASKLHGAT